VDVLSRDSASSPTGFAEAAEVPSPSRTSRLLLAGASVRAAAQSACRAGCTVVAVDLFADADLRTIADVLPVRSVSNELEAAAERIPPSNWSYTGALENDPLVVDKVSRRHTLCGNSGNVLRAVRDPRELAHALTSAGLQYPESIVGQMVPSPGQWLSKPLRSCGGTGVHLLAATNSGAGNDDSAEERRYLQRRIEGTVCSATYVAAAGSARLLGVSQQLNGQQWCGAQGFQYAGSIGPLALGARLRREFISIGDCLADRFALRGLFGVDVVIDDPLVWTIEVNPRYCASVEVLERASDRSYIAVHLEACLQGQLPGKWPEARQALHGKAVVYARCPTVISSDCFKALVTENTDGAGQPWVADLPHADTRIEPGHPIVTIFATGCDVAQVIQGLQLKAQRIYVMTQSSLR
jgi:predicted ATP-grasp superfamily ATP-dependent carboligase